MANQFKNRLVGTIILVVLGVTVLRMLFDGKKTLCRPVYRYSTRIQR